MKINFGKYAGSTVKEVAIVDAGYASWAANNLKNVALRNAFSQALIDAKIAKVEEIAAAHVDPSSAHYGKVLEMVTADKALANASKSRKAEILNRYAKILNVPAQTLIEKVKPLMIQDIDVVKQLQFSSETVKVNFVKMMTELFNA